MSQMGMNLPGAARRRGATMDIYTGLLFVAVVALIAACAVVFVNGSRIGKGGSAFGLQEPPTAGKSNLQFLDK
ncbi:MAG: hypothetical protein K2Q09_03010 [Phycisphaerales bacterium]|nr:hypothetical protein [Phycisphaerales bacterium]